MKKKILLTFSLLFFFLCYQGAFALTYKDTIIAEIRSEENTQENIDQAKLLEKYIRNYKKDIGTLEEKYEVTNSFVLSTYKKELDTMVRALRKTQTLLIEKSDAEEVRSSVVKGLKDINVLIKEALKKEQIRFENRIQTTKNIYIGIGKKISSVILNLTKDLTAVLSKKNTLSSSEKEVVRSLVRLNEVNDSIKEFSGKTFETKEEMRIYYTEIIRNLRKEIALIKSLIKN